MKLEEIVKKFEVAKGVRLNIGTLIDDQLIHGYKMSDMVFIDQGKKYLTNIIESKNEYDKHVCAFRLAIANDLGLQLGGNIPVNGLIGTNIKAVYKGKPVVFVKTNPNTFYKFKTFKNILKQIIDKDLDTGDMAAFFGCSELSLNELIGELNNE